MPHPTINPSLDEILEFDENDGPNGLRQYIEKNMTLVKRHDIDNTIDGLEISVPFSFLMINMLPILDSKVFTLLRAKVQTLAKEITIISELEEEAEENRQEKEKMAKYNKDFEDHDINEDDDEL